MAGCPRCNVRLIKRKTPNGVVYACPKCGGRNVAFTVLRRAGVAPGFMKQVWQQCCAPDAKSHLRCPHCHRRTVRVTMGSGDQDLSLDVCTFCRAVWFDGSELKKVLAARPPERQLSPEMREKLALVQIEMEQRLHALDGGLLAGEGPPEWWQWGPALAGMPVEEESPARESRPWLTWFLAAAVAMVFVVTAGDLDEAVRDFGFAPSLSTGYGALTIFTAFFIHAGVFHLVANLYFFLIFGDNVEDDLGRGLFILLLLGSHLAGMALHAGLDPRSDIALVGASAGITGVLGYYALTFPKARLGVFWRYAVFFKYDRMPALVYLGLYVILQLLGAREQVGGFGGVSYLAHLGGLAVGCLTASGVRLAKMRPPEFVRDA